MEVIYLASMTLAETINFPGENTAPFALFVHIVLSVWKVLFYLARHIYSYAHPQIEPSNP